MLLAVGTKAPRPIKGSQELYQNLAIILISCKSCLLDTWLKWNRRWLGFFPSTTVLPILSAQQLLPSHPSLRAEPHPAARLVPALPQTVPSPKLQLLGNSFWQQTPVSAVVGGD